jgi:hypothetical protein
VIRTTVSESHGDARRGATAPLYRVWYSILQRCTNPKIKSFKDYGGRGITVCSEWKESYIAFRTWAHANGYVKGLYIDRENNDGGYSPDNCRWVTSKVSSQNKRMPTSRVHVLKIKIKKSRMGYNTGENHPFAKLRSEQVAEIKFRCTRGEKMRPLAREFGVGYFEVWRIARGRGWKNIQPLDGLELFSS